ncbi:MAG TPA: ABC transporter ATP-binding protein [Bryobacteraceae bacterium]|nr:ABC transporter ATP-binding protein [Bryobacteraceae bacterium]
MRNTVAQISNYAVSCRQVKKEFGTGENRALVLRGVDFEVAFGEMTLLVGPSGCGKTTLLSVIAGLLDATAGEIAVLGQNMADLSGSDSISFRRKNLGFVFQQYNLLPALTAAENAAVPLLAAGVSRKRAVDRASAVLSEIGLEHRLHALPRELSGGQQQRVALARALVHEPRLIVCDEPTSALDHETGHAVMDLLTKVAVRRDRAVIVVTHDSRVFDFADRIAHMDDGRIVKTETLVAEPAAATIN